jgi:hypothetical protein
MTVADMIQLIFTLLSSAALMIGGIKWFINSQIKELKAEIKEIGHEIRPNGGQSIKDQVSRIELQQNQQHNAMSDRIDEADIIRRDMDKKLDKMYSILIEYIAKN